MPVDLKIGLVGQFFFQNVQAASGELYHPTATEAMEVMMAGPFGPFIATTPVMEIHVA